MLYSPNSAILCLKTCFVSWNRPQRHENMNEIVTPRTSLKLLSRPATLQTNTERISWSRSQPLPGKMAHSDANVSRRVVIVVVRVDLLDHREELLRFGQVTDDVIEPLRKAVASGYPRPTGLIERNEECTHPLKERDA